VDRFVISFKFFIIIYPITKNIRLKANIQFMKTSTYDIFLSFADEDKNFALALCKILNENQISVWCSATHVPAGADIHAAVSKALPNCEYFLPLISKNYHRAWHEKEFHSASHNRHNDLIIPVLYQTNYTIIEQNMHLFSLISSIRMLEANDENINEITQNITSKITTKNNQIFNNNITTFKTIFSEKILHNRIAQIFIFTSLLSLSCMSVYDYISEKEIAKEKEKSQKILQQKIADLTDTLVLEGKAVMKENGNGLKSVIQQDEDRFALKIQNVVAEKLPNGLQKLHFTIKNKSDKSLFFNGLVLEISRNRGDIDFKEKNLDIQTVGIWEVEIPNDMENTKYNYSISKAPKKLIGKDEIVELCLVLFQEENKKRILPKPFTIRAVFLTNEKITLSSNEFFFNKKGEFVYDE
jgi:hypothetical protein